MRSGQKRREVDKRQTFEHLLAEKDGLVELLEE
jgi:hypothetical protein